jgi:uncharacterized membrane protein
LVRGARWQLRPKQPEQATTSYDVGSGEGRNYKGAKATNFGSFVLQVKVNFLVCAAAAGDAVQCDQGRFYEAYHSIKGAFMNTDTIFMMVTVFLISIVEMIEMSTIVVAVGLQRGWFATLLGGGVGLIGLAVLVIIFGSLLGNLSLDPLQAIIGILLLLFGVQWLRKSIYRISMNGFWSGQEEPGKNVPKRKKSIQGLDWTAFARGFQGVFLEGLEIVFVVISFGAGVGHIGWGAVAGGAAVVVVTAVALLARRWLELIPGNTFKFLTGILLTTYGTFWATSGMGAEFPGEDYGVIGVLIVVILFAVGAVFAARKLRQISS